MADNKDNKTVDSEMTLEESMQELSEIVAQMERGGMPLEETFALYKNGRALLKQCKDAIDRVEKEMEILESDEDDEDGE